MGNCAYCRKKIVLRLLLSVLDLKPSKIADELHVSRSLVSKYLSGERTSTELDIYFIEQAFLVDVKEVSQNVK